MERITVLVGGSAEGENKPLLVIGKAGMPRAFRGKNLPVEYNHNRRAWVLNAEEVTWTLINNNNNRRA